MWRRSRPTPYAAAWGRAAPSPWPPAPTRAASDRYRCPAAAAWPGRGWCTTFPASNGVVGLKMALHGGDRKSVVEGERVSVRVDRGGRRIIKKKKKQIKTNS